VSTPTLKETIKTQLQAFSVGSYIYQSTVARRFGLHPTDMLAIHHLEQKGEMTAGHLGKLLGLTSGATTAVIDRLIKSGFAGRKTQDQDRRHVYIHLNQANIKKLKTSYKVVDEKLAQILDRYSEKDLQVVGDFLNALSQIDT